MQPRSIFDGTLLKCFSLTWLFDSFLTWLLFHKITSLGRKAGEEGRIFSYRKRTKSFENTLKGEICNFFFWTKRS